MDDKETKNIDGIKMPDQAPTDGDAVQVNVTTGENQQDTSTDVTITTDGDIATEPEVTDDPAESREASEDQSAEEAPVPVPVAPVAPAQPVEPAKEDPGIVPSVQPTTPAAATPATELVRLKEKNKSLKIWLVVLMLLLVGVASALVVYFAQQSKSKNDLKTQQQQNASLQSQLTQQQQNATQTTIDNLNEQLAAEKQKNADLQKTIDEQKTQLSSYQTAVKQLLAACGTACSDVNVPTTTTGNNTTN